MAARTLIEADAQAAQVEHRAVGLNGRFLKAMPRRGHIPGQEFLERRAVGVLAVFARQSIDYQFHQLGHSGRRLIGISSALMVISTTCTLTGISVSDFLPNRWQ